MDGEDVDFGLTCLIPKGIKHVNFEDGSDNDIDANIGVDDESSEEDAPESIAESSFKNRNLKKKLRKFQEYKNVADIRNPSLN